MKPSLINLNNHKNNNNHYYYNYIIADKEKISFQSVLNFKIDHHKKK